MTENKDIPYREILAEHSALWADKYALTMAQAFFASNKHEVKTTFHAFIRRNPFSGGYLVTGGQNIVLEWMTHHWRFDETDITLLRKSTVTNHVSGKETRLFSDDFLEMLAGAKLELTIDAMPEGEIAFPDEPIFRVHGPLWQCLMVEAGILNLMNSQSLFATLGSRLVEVADGGKVLEFGLRRAQAAGGLEPSRGSYLGGVHGSSNMLAEKYYGIPTAGTFAHALVMVYEDELEAFRDYAKALPHNGVFLVDTYDSLSGVRRAVQTCFDTGTVLAGIRLDSGDLTYLSRKARKILDEAGFTEAQIVASNELDEGTIDAIRNEGGIIDVWGVGTHLATASSQPALGGVYKLGAVFGDGLSAKEIEATRQLVRRGGAAPTDAGFMRGVIKLSEQIEKITIPGELDVLRFVTRKKDGKLRFNGDTIIPAFAETPVSDGKLKQAIRSVRKNDPTLIKEFSIGTEVYTPLKRMMAQGKLVTEIETVHQARARVQQGIDMLDSAYRRLRNPHEYVVGIEKDLFDHRTALIKKLRQANS